MNISMLIIITGIASLLATLIYRSKLVAQRAYFSGLQERVNAEEWKSIEWYLGYLRTRIIRQDTKVVVLTVLVLLTTTMMGSSIDVHVNGLGFMVWASAGLLAFSWWRQHTFRSQHKTVDDSLQEDNRPPVLYLRSFVTDTDAPIDATQFGLAKGKPLSSYERQAIHFAQYAGPVIAIAAPGHPADKITGAAKQHYGDDWQQHILAYMKKATLVIMRPYNNEGVLWEFEQLVKHGYLGKTILYMHRGVRKHRQNEAALAAFRQQALERWNIDVGELNDQKPFIYFDEELAAWETDIEFDIPVFRKVFYEQYLLLQQSD